MAPRQEQRRAWAGLHLIWGSGPWWEDWVGSKPG